MKKEIKNRYVQLWVADCISQSYLKELMEGAKKQQELLVETPSEDLFSFAYILTNGDRLVIIH